MAASGTEPAGARILGVSLDSARARLPAIGPAAAAAVWGGCIGHAALLGDVAPFGIAYVAAVRRVDPPRAAWAAAGALAGAALRAPTLGGVAVQAIALLLAVLMVGALEGRTQTPVWAGAVAVGLLAAAAGWAVAPSDGITFVYAAVDAVVAGALFVPFGDGARAAAGRPARRLTLDGADGAGLLVLVAVALASTAPLGVAGVPVGMVLAPLAAMLAARVGGAGAGAAAGLVVGGILELAGGVGPATTLMAAGGALVAAWGRRHGTAWAVLAATAAGLAFARALGPGPTALVGGLAAYLLAVGVAWLTPSAPWELAASYLGLTAARPDRNLRRRLRDISRVFGLLSSAVGESAAAVAGDPTAPGRLEPDRLVQGVTRRACPGCPRYERCWDRETELTFRRLQDDMARFPGDASESALEDSLRTWCLRPRHVAIALGYVRDLHEVERRLVRRWRATRAALAEPLRGVSELLGQEVDGQPAADEASPDGLAFAWGVAGRPRGGRSGQPNGDATVVRPLPGARLLVAMSDGMGVGAAAAVESEPTVQLADRLLGTGFGIRTAAQTVNSLMVLEGGEDTFATLDLALVHLDTGEAEFVKIGAPPTLLVRRGRLERVEVHAPPSGILHEVRVEVRRRRVGAGDWLVSMTDGAYDVLTADADWLEGFLRALHRARGPQWVADQLLDRCTHLAGERMDDATVAVVRLGPGLPEA